MHPSRVYRLIIASAGLIAATVSPRPSSAAWPTTGLPIATGATEQHVLAAASDGSDGAFVVWRESPATIRRVIRIDGDGQVGAGWPANGLLLSNAATFLGATADGAGGLIVCFLTAPAPVTNGSQRDFRAWRYTHDGALSPGWPAAGVLVYGDFKSVFDSTPFAGLSEPKVFGDGLGGGHLTMRFAGSPDAFGVHHMRVLANGTPGPYFNAEASVIGPNVVVPLSDGAGGIDEMHHRFSDGLRAVKYSAAGVLTSQRTLTNDDRDHQLKLLRLAPSSDLLAWWAVSNSEMNTRRITSALGDAAGWPSATTDARYIPLISDEMGGVFARSLITGGNEIQSVSYATATPMPQWSTPQLPMFKNGPIVADGAGGFFLVWEGPGVGSLISLGATHHLSNGDPGLGWLPTGREVSSSILGPPHLVRSTPGVAFVAWTDRRGGVFDVFLQRLADDAVVPVAASLARADAHADRVELEWSVIDAPAELFVERSVSGGEWVRLAGATMTANERWTFEDRDVRAGDAIAYRLTGREGVVPGSEAFVRIPVATALALRGFLANPSPGDATVEFALPDAAAATLELIDVTGRTIERREVGELGAGQHRVRLVADRTLSPGLYFIRLQRGEETRKVRASVVR